MKLVLPGGSGHVGTILARSFHAGGDDVVVLSRAPGGAAPWRTVAWDARTLGPWVRELEGADAVVNLAGRSVNCRYTRSNREAIMRSRVDSAGIVGEAISRAERPPRAWLQMSTATIYAHSVDRANDEATGVIGEDPRAPDTWHFSHDVATSWERAVDEAITPSTRKLKLRTAIVLGPGRGGPFDLLLRLVRLGLGGTAGDGRQWVSWIHHEDFVRAVRFLIEREDLDGAVNLASPHPLPNAPFMRELREAWGIGIGLPAPAWLLGIAAFFMRTETELILKSRRVVPGRLLSEGFAFEHPAWSEAARDLCREVRA